MDLIDREQAIKALEKGFIFHAYAGGMAKRIVENVPSAEKAGKWIKNDNDTFSCSLCQSWIPNEQHHYAKYCLYCGARMED